MPIDLLKTEFLSCSLLADLPEKDVLLYMGVIPPHFQKYRAMVRGAERTILVATVIRRNEIELWEGARDLLGRAVTEASLRMRGIYSFELLGFDLQKEIQTFNYAEVAQMLFNTSRLMRPGDERLIRYSSLYGILRKLVDESWGKISFITVVEILAEAPESLYKLLGKALKKADEISAPLSVVIKDISAVPLYDPLCENQRAAFTELCDKLAKKVPPFPRECWVEGARIFADTEKND